jgi:uncharacterized membrane protein
MKSNVPKIVAILLLIIGRFTIVLTLIFFFIALYFFSYLSGKVHGVEASGYLHGAILFTTISISLALITFLPGWFLLKRKKQA